MPHDLINVPISAALKEFFGSSQLSQFMDQTNRCPRSRTSGASRPSAWRPDRERAGFEVRDVHQRTTAACPIETPEGPNIGLINRWRCTRSQRKYGSSRRRTAASKTARSPTRRPPVGDRGRQVRHRAGQRPARRGRRPWSTSWCRPRERGESVLTSRAHPVHGRGADADRPVAASLVPFLEHDDANRALMGANMQRQASAGAAPRRPLVGTGVEHVAAVDSGTAVTAARGGVVDYVDTNRHRDPRQRRRETVAGEVGVDIYNPDQSTSARTRTPTSTSASIVKRGDVVAAVTWSPTAPATDLASSALGQKCWSRSCPWNGYNFEDSIPISERVVADDRYTRSTSRNW